MPLGSFFRKDKSGAMSDKERKSKLGMKVMLAQQNPEPVYDLSDCAMIDLPPDTFVMCKLLQKTSLILKNNLITNFEKGGKCHELECLEVLDLSKNKLSHIPDEIHKLKNLRVLKLNENKLKNLPSLFGELNKLQELDLSSNKLSKVPTSLCALPNLKVLALSGNSITLLPKEFCELQKSLCTLDLDVDKLQSPLVELASGVEAIMRHLCESHGIEYEGLRDPSELDSTPSTSPPPSAGFDTSENEDMLNYFKKKADMVKFQLAAEEAMQLKEQAQLAQVLKDTSSNKQHLLEELSQAPQEAMDYERKKLAMMQDQFNIKRFEENLEKEQAEALEKYLASSTNKEALISDLSAQQADLDIEVEGLVSAKERERHRLLMELASSEKETAAAVSELVCAAASRRSEEFICLLNEQEKEMQSLLSGIAESSAELRRADVVVAMQAALVEEAKIEQRRMLFQKEQGSRICTLLEDNDLVNTHLEGVMSTKAADHELWTTTLSEDEECQAAAFKLLLLKTDLKRNNILRQIGQVEYELARLSSLEVRKKKLGVKYGSNTMLDQRATLAGLLKSLLTEKKERESQLITWYTRVEGMHSDTEDDFWLIQYQRLLTMKPAGLAEAEEQLEPKVRAILHEARAPDLIPVFARHGITFSRMLEMTEEDASQIGIGHTTYQGLQRTLQIHLAAEKLGPQDPSAPCEEDLPGAPSAPEMEADPDAPSAPEIEEGATAPPLDEQYVEAECVICLDTSCEVVFLPCGHVCACGKCCASLVTCPMCRAPVISKILLSY